MVPANWREITDHRDQAWARARPAGELLAHYPAVAGELHQASRAAGVPIEALRFLPVVSRRKSGVALLAGRDLRILRYLPLDGFF